MTLKDFINANGVQFTYNRVDKDFLPVMEKLIETKTGEQLRNYILSYGYLGYKYIEFYGVNNIQEEKSDMIVNTVFLHSTYEATKGLIAFEDWGDGDYYLVDENDMMYRFLIDDESLEAKNIKLEDYILERFMSV